MIVVVTLDPKVAKDVTRCLNKLKGMTRGKWPARDGPCMRLYTYDCNRQNSERVHVDRKAA